jgi:hypothetical protein
MSSASSSTASWTLSTTIREHTGRISSQCRHPYTPADLDSDEYHVFSDTDKVLEYFYEKCVLAGPLQCALYEKTPAAVKARVDKIFQDLLTHPIPTVVGTGAQDYGLVDYTMVLNLMFEILSIPFVIGGQTMAALFVALEQRNGSLWYETNIGDPRYFLQCSCDETIVQSSGGFGSLGGIAIGCSDADPFNGTLADLQAGYEANANESMFAGVWPNQVYCA